MQQPLIRLLKKRRIRHRLPVCHIPFSPLIHDSAINASRSSRHTNCISLHPPRATLHPLDLPMTGLRSILTPGFRIIPRVLLCLVVAGTLALAGCSMGEGEGQGPGHRAQSLALTPEQELSLGRKAYQEVLRKSHVVGGPDARRISNIGSRIARAAEIRPLQREINLRVEGYTWEWEYALLEDKQINAFCLPGGKVAVFTGLIPVAENDDQLATVLAHEIAHALAHHASERIAREQMYERAMAVANGAIGSIAPGERRELIGLLGEASGTQLGLQPPTGVGSRSHRSLFDDLRRLRTRTSRPLLGTHATTEHRAYAPARNPFRSSQRWEAAFATQAVGFSRASRQIGLERGSYRSRGEITRIQLRSHFPVTHGDKQMSSGPLFGGGDFFGNAGPRSPYGAYPSCGCSSLFIILAGILTGLRRLPAHDWSVADRPPAHVYPIEFKALKRRRLCDLFVERSSRPEP